MPKVSEEHLERRRRQILDAANTCFTRKGFYATSMQDIFAESGLSAGAVYRYFPSKTDIVRAIASRNQGIVAGFLRALLDRDVLPPLGEMVGGFAAGIAGNLGEGGPLSAAPQGWAAAVYDQEFGPDVRALFAGAKAAWIRIAVRLRDERRLPADCDPAAVGAVLFSLVPGFILQYQLLGDIDAAILASGVEGLVGYTDEPR